MHVITLDALIYGGNLDILARLPDPSRHTFVHGDIRDEALVIEILRDHRVYAIVNIAANTPADHSLLRPPQFMRTNVQGVVSRLEASCKFWLADPDWVSGAS